MAAITKDEKIFITVDPGFDSVKVLVNGFYQKFPKEVVDITELDESKFIGNKTGAFLKASYIEGKQHLVGEYAAKFLSERNKKEGGQESEMIHDTFETFKTTDRQISIMSAIGKGLIDYTINSKNSVVSFVKQDDGSFDVNTGIGKLYVGVAMPHDAVDEWSYIRSWLKGEHKFKLETRDGVYNFDLDIKNIMDGSQVISALFGTLTDDEGNFIDDNALSEDKLPAIVIDGGYYTVGMAHFTSVKLVDDSASNLTYAMKNIYEMVAKQIREESKRTDVTSARVKQVMRSKDKTINYYVEEEEKGYSIDVESLVKTATGKVCEDMIAELRQKYNNLVDIKTLLVTGGTGIAYYEHIKEILAGCPWINVELTDYDFMGEEITPDFAIVIGMYKVLKAAVADHEKNKR